jgi:hypothetical protein
MVKWLVYRAFLLNLEKVIVHYLDTAAFLSVKS